MKFKLLAFCPLLLAFRSEVCDDYILLLELFLQGTLFLLSCSGAGALHEVEILNLFAHSDHLPVKLSRSGKSLLKLLSKVPFPLHLLIELFLKFQDTDLLMGNLCLRIADGALEPPYLICA